MSRLAKRPIAIPPKTEVTVSGSSIVVKGPKGTLEKPLHRLVSIEVGADGVQVSPKGESLESKALIGTYASHVRNMLQGVNNGFSKKLIVEGVGYKWELKGKQVQLALGFSHPILVNIPEGLAVKVDKGTMEISGANVEQVGQFAANIRALKKPEPYKGKGIRYDGEVIRRKQGKKAA